MERKGILEESSSNWVNPDRLTRKLSGKLRFTLDLRKLNEMTDLDEFCIPNINEITRPLHNMAIFSVIDLEDGYFQVPLHRGDRDKTTFYPPDNRLLRFTKMLQGYKNSPATFQKGMTMMLNGLIGVSCFVYLDDIIVFGRDKAEHNRNLEEDLENTI